MISLERDGIGNFIGSGVDIYVEAEFGQVGKQL